MNTHRALLVSMLALAGAIAFAQGRDPGTTSYRETQNDGSTKVIWEVASLESVTSIPDTWSTLDSNWMELSTSPQRDANTIARLAGRYVQYNKDKSAWLAVPNRQDVLQWYSDLAALNGRTFDITTDILKYNEANGAYARDKANYEATSVTEANQASMNAWYQRLVAEHQRVTDWFARIGQNQEALKPVAQGISGRAQTINSGLNAQGDRLDDFFVALDTDVSNELEIARTSAKLEEVREKVKANNDKLRDISKVNATVQEAEDWAALAESEREKGQWDALLSLASVAVTQTSNKYTALEKVTREELRAVKQTLMYKFKLPPDVAKKVLKNWVDDGRSVLTIKTKRELFEQLGTLVTVADAADKSSRSEYLEALAGCLGVFVKTPALNLLVTDIQIYLSLFNTGFTYYHAKERVNQLLALSEASLKAVRSLAELNKKIVDDELLPLKKSLADLVAKRTY